MNIRTGTKEKYIAFLHRIGGLTTAFDADEEAKKDKVDLKIITFLKSKNYLTVYHLAGAKRVYESNYTPESVPLIFNEFLRYRNEIETSYEDTQYLLKHKDIAKKLLDEYFNPTIKLTTKAELDKETITEIVKYTKLGIELNKTDLIGFVQTIYNTK